MNHEDPNDDGTVYHADGTPCLCAPWMQPEDLNTISERHFDGDTDIAVEYFQLLREACEQTQVFDTFTVETYTVDEDRGEQSRYLFSPAFVRFCNEASPQLHERALTLARVNCGRVRVSLAGENGILLLTRGEHYPEPDIDALRASLDGGNAGEDPATSG